MVRRTYLWTSTLIILTCAALAYQPVLMTDLVKTSSGWNGSVRFTYGKSNTDLSGYSELRVVLYKNGQEVRTQGVIASMSPHAEDPKKRVTASIPASANITKLALIGSGDEVLYEKRLQLCDNDLECDEGENVYSCENDCGPASSDDVCLDETDGACDPDCASDVDPDCQNGETPVQSEGLNRSQWYDGARFAVASLLLLAILYAIAKYYKD